MRAIMSRIVMLQLPRSFPAMTFLISAVTFSGQVSQRERLRPFSAVVVLIQALNSWLFSVRLAIFEKQVLPAHLH